MWGLAGMFHFLWAQFHSGLSNNPTFKSHQWAQPICVDFFLLHVQDKLPPCSLTRQSSLSHDGKCYNPLSSTLNEVFHQQVWVLIDLQCPMATATGRYHYVARVSWGLIPRAHQIRLWPHPRHSLQRIMRLPQHNSLRLSLLFTYAKLVYVYLKFNPEMSMTNMSALLPKSSLTACTCELHCDKILVKNNLSNERLLLAHTSMVQCLMHAKEIRKAGS